MDRLGRVFPTGSDPVWPEFQARPGPGSRVLGTLATPIFRENGVWDPISGQI